MFHPTAKVICDSISPLQDRLITLEVEMHRFVLAEFNTHRQFSRNFQSSRAIPVERLLELVLTSPAKPLHYGKNQPGMQADQESNARVVWPWGAQGENGEIEYRDYSVEEAWGFAGEVAATLARAFHKAGYHKQIVNRLIEPFLPVRGIVTATEEAFKHFFSLRCHPAAQPEIQALANVMRDAIKESQPKKLKYGDWHLPYINTREVIEGWTPRTSYYTQNGEQVTELSLDSAIKISISCNAQVSYRKLDDSLEKAWDIYYKLNLPSDGVYPSDPPHFSPAEHVAKCCFTSTEFSGNFACRSFIQYRKALEVGLEKIITRTNDEAANTISF